MTPDQKIAVWNAVGTWLAGLATFLAVLVSLWLARRTNKSRLAVSSQFHEERTQQAAGSTRGIANVELVTTRFIQVQITNLGDRPVTIINVGWLTHDWRWWKPLRLTQGFTRGKVPHEIAHGKYVQFQIDVTHSQANWFEDTIGLIRSGGFGRGGVQRFRPIVRTTLGEDITGRVSPGVRAELMQTWQGTENNR